MSPIPGFFAIPTLSDRSFSCKLLRIWFISQVCIALSSRILFLKSRVVLASRSGLCLLVIGPFCYGRIHIHFCKPVRATPARITKSPLNVRAGQSGHFLPSNGGHQICPDWSGRTKSHKPEPNVGEVRGRPDVHHVGLRQRGPTSKPLSLQIVLSYYILAVKEPLSW